MFSSRRERGHNDEIPAVIKTPDYGKQNLEHLLILSQVNAVLLAAIARKKKDPLRAA